MTVMPLPCYAVSEAGGCGDLQAYTIVVAVASRRTQTGGHRVLAYSAHSAMADDPQVKLLVTVSIVLLHW